jgi:putative chitinase
LIAARDFIFEGGFMFSIDRKKFFTYYRNRFGPLSQNLVDALSRLLVSIEQDQGFVGTETDRRQLAYCLATFKWETAHTLRPIDEFGSDEYFDRRYSPQTRVGRVLGNTQQHDGSRFHGRGYVQLTGRSNYDRAGNFLQIDLINNPDQAKEEVIAYQIAIQGMKIGWFTGKRLSQFIRQNIAPNYEGARSIINPNDKAQTIAEIARRFDEVLAFST